MAIPSQMPRMQGLAICSGIGGFDLGLSLVVRGYRTVCYVEREAHAAATLATRMQNGALVEAPIWSDVATFSGLAWREKVDIVTTGFPCQPWSSAGRQAGIEDERWIWPAIMRVVRGVEPWLVFIENTPMLYPDGFRIIEENLAKAGYIIPDPIITGANDVGSSQIRKRIWILAYHDRDGLALERFRGLLDGFGATLRSHADRCDQDVGDGHDIGFMQASMPVADQAQDTGTGMRNFRSVWPPGRSIEEWEAILPENQPAIPRVDHGVSCWMERVRETGSACVPAVAAHAFVESVANIVRRWA